MKHPENSEGPNARENFERAMTAIFQVPRKKVEARKRRQQHRKAATVHKSRKAECPTQAGFAWAGDCPQAGFLFGVAPVWECSGIFLVRLRWDRNV